MDASTLLGLIGLSPNKARKTSTVSGSPDRESDRADPATRPAGPATKAPATGARIAAAVSSASPLRTVEPAPAGAPRTGSPAPASPAAARPPSSSPGNAAPGGTYSYGRPQTSAEAITAAALAVAKPAPSALPSLAGIARDYPHVMAKLRVAWHDPERFDRLIQELLTPERPGRMGFPPEVLVQLSRLQDYYALYSVSANGRIAPSWPDDSQR